MRIKNTLERLSGAFPHSPASISDDVLRGFLRVLESIRREDLPCAEVFARLDEYVEKEVRGKDAARLMPLLREHLDLCAPCHDEYEALLSILENAAA